jgi:hypothetical protein
MISFTGSEKNECQFEKKKKKKQKRHENRRENKRMKRQDIIFGCKIHIFPPKKVFILKVKFRIFQDFRTKL